MKPDNIYNPTANEYPPSLVAHHHWSTILLEWHEDRQKFSKTPTNINTGLPANSDDMGGQFDLAWEHLDLDRVLCYRRPISAALRLGLIDCDNCIEPDGSISPLVQALLRFMNAYAEVSVSGNGIHVLSWLYDVPPDGHKDGEWDIEFYWSPRAIPITGKRVVLPDWESPVDITDGTKNFLKLHKARFPQAWTPSPPACPALIRCELSADEILALIFNEPHGRKWRDVYEGFWQDHYASPSDADLALLVKISFYTGKDRQMMEEIFAASPLSRILIRGTVADPKKWTAPKWRDPKYRDRTLDEAIRRTTSVYRPKQMSDLEFINMRSRQIREKRKRQ